MNTQNTIILSAALASSLNLTLVHAFSATNASFPLTRSGNGQQILEYRATCAATWDWVNPLPQGNSLRAITYGNGQYVAVGNHGAIIVSADGITWNLRNSGTTKTLDGIAYNGNKFVAVGEQGLVLESADAVTWVSHQATATNIDLLNVIWNATKSTFVAGGNNSILLSADGVTWNKIAVANADIYSIIWDGNRYLAVGTVPYYDTVTTSAPLFTSADGVTWNRIAATIPTKTLVGIAYNGTQYIAVGDGSTIFNSTDGISWTAQTQATWPALYDVVWNGNQFVAVGDGGAIRTSSNGTTWTARSIGSGRLFYVMWSNNKFTTVGEAGAIFQSSNGAAWTARHTGTTRQLNNLIHTTDSNWVAVGDLGTILTSSDNGSTWVTSVSGANHHQNSVVHNGVVYVTVGDGGKILTSVDATTWTPQTSGTTKLLDSVIWNGNFFLAVGDSGTVLTSPDAVTWTLRSAGISVNLNSAANNTSQFVTVGDGGNIFTSADGVAWTGRSSGTTQALQDVAWDGSQFAAVGGDGTILTSANGVVWELQANGTPGSLNGITGEDGDFIAVGDSWGQSTILTSVDGIFWDEYPSITSSSLQAVAASDDVRLAVGENGTILRNTCSNVAPTAPSAMTNAASQLSANGATFNGQVSSNGATTTVTFDYGTSTSYGTNVVATPNSITAASSNVLVTKIVTGLTCATQYHFRIKAVNSVGTSYGADQSFTTLTCPVVAPIVTTNAATNVTATAATLNGNVTSDGATATVTFDFGTTTSYGTSIVANPSQIYSASAVAVSATKTGLTCGTVYHYRAKGVNSVGTGLGLDQSFTTNACPITAPTATTGTASGATTNTAVISGQVNPNGANTTVTFNWGLTTSYGTNVVAMPATISAGSTGGSTGSPSAVTAYLTGLTCNSVYHYRVKAQNSIGTTYGADKTLTTAPCGCGSTWEVQNSTTTNVIKALAWNEVTFVAVTSNGINSSSTITSTDGVTWTERSIIGYPYLDVIWAGTQFVAVGPYTVVATSPDGITWATHSINDPYLRTSVAWNGSLLVNVGGNGTVYTSPDGVTWTARNSGNTNIALTDITWSESSTGSNNKFVAVGYRFNYGDPAPILTSPDGTNWTTQSTGIVNALRAVTWSGNQFVAVGDYGNIATSLDGITWATHNLGTQYQFNSVTWNGTQFVAVGTTGTAGTIITSPDGINWSNYTFGTANLKSVIWSGNSFIAAGDGGTILRSTCAPITAPTATTGVAPGATTDIAIINGQVKSNGATTTVTFDYGPTTSYGTNVAATPATISGASAITNTVTAHLTGLNCNTTYHYRIKAVNSVGTTYGANKTLSTEPCGCGTTWTTQNSNVTDAINGLAWNGILTGSPNAQIAAVTNNNSTLTSSDGINWAEHHNAIGSFQDIIWATTQFVAVGNYTAISTSPDGTTWTARNVGDADFFNNVAWSGSKLVATGGGDTIATSADGITWAKSTSNTIRNCRATTWGGSSAGSNNQFVAVCDPLAMDGHAYFATSQDGVTWTKGQDSNATYLGDVIWGGNQFVAVGVDGSVETSRDGITWIAHTSGTQNQLNAITYNGIQFVAVGEVGTVLTSPDGIDWVKHSAGSANLNTVTWNGTSFVAAGADGAIVRSSCAATIAVPTATTNVATSITQTSVILNGNVVSNGAIATVSFDFGPTTSYGTNIAATPATLPATSSGNVSANKTGLICNTTYNYRVKAVNSVGTSLGANRSFKTLACPTTPPTASTSLATTIAATSATLVGQVTPNGAVTTVTFDLGKTETYGLNVTATPSPLAATAANTKVTYAASGLDCNTNYYYRVKAVNSAGTSYGGNVIFKTLTCPKTPRALLIGGGTAAGDPVGAAGISYQLGLTYAVLKKQGYNVENSGRDEIKILGNGLNVTYNGTALPVQTVHLSDFVAGTALTQWLQGAERLVIYLIGHGEVGYFDLDQTTGERLTATALDAWLDLIQPSVTNIAVIDESCHSGSFLPTLAELPSSTTVPKRLLIASAASDQMAAFIANGRVSYSQIFWLKVLEGFKLKDAHYQALLWLENRLGNPQVPQLEADGDVTTGNNDSADLQLASNFCFGFTLNNGTLTANQCKAFLASTPTIDSVTAVQTLNGTRSANLELTAATSTGIASAWVVIERPDYQIDPTQSFASLPTIALTQDATNPARWVGRYAPGDLGSDGVLHRGLDVRGEYKLDYYIASSDGLISAPKSSSVVQNIGFTPFYTTTALVYVTKNQLSFPTAQLWNTGLSRSVFTRANATSLFQLNSLVSLANSGISNTNPPRWSTGSTGSPSVVNIPQLIKTGDTKIYRGTLKRESATGTQSQWTFSLSTAPFICGDADGNGVVNIVDALAVARKVVNLPPPPAVNDTADVDSNGQIVIADALSIAKFAVGLAVTETCLD